MVNLNQTPHLTGTDHEKAGQLLDLMNEKELSVELLETIVPPTLDFFKEFVSCLRDQIENEAKNDEQFLHIMDNLLCCLKTRMSDNTITEVERKEIINSINVCSHELCEWKKVKEKENSSFKKWLTGCVAALGAIVIIFGRKDS